MSDSSAQRRVHLGSWTDWSRGPVMGVTLTLDRKQGALLIAFTAFFVGIVASCFWRILVFFVYRLYSTAAPRDALHHQRQALLRNSVTAPSTLWAFSQLCWTWRRAGASRLRRTLPVIVCALVSIALFAVASGFSSQIASGTGSAALLDGSHCGYVQGATQASRLDDLGVLFPYGVRRLTESANYAQQCYSARTGAGLLSCGTFVLRSLPYTSNHQASCPFRGGICRSNTSNLMLDTGYLDSHEHLGVNSSPDLRIRFRTMLHCAPLETEGYSTDIRNPSRNYTRYFYGRRTHESSPDRDGNYTLQVRALSDQYGWYYRNADNQDAGYSPSIQNYVAFVRDGRFSANGSEFEPIPQLSRADGDIMIFFLVGNGATFMRPTPDLWYRGTASGKNVSVDHSADKLSLETYEPEEAASPLGCVQQHQFCDSSGRCGPLAGYLDALQGAHILFNSTALGQYRPDEKPDTLFGSFRRALGQSLGTIDFMVSSFQSNSLLSQQVSSSGLRGPLPDNQWQMDVNYWWDTMLATMQASFVQLAAWTADRELEPYVTHLNSSYICRNQKILTSEYTAFSVFGLCFTYSLGCVIILISFGLEPTLDFLGRRRKPQGYTSLERQSYQLLQLQRAAYQGIGSGIWQGFTGAVPTTKGVEVLADLASRYGGSEKMTGHSAVDSDDTRINLDEDDVVVVSPTIPRRHSTT
ncbi:hypothetical protein L249_0884 [Ophiocordyceps polyrhachis-furcata BCC 54312]|uniref:Uncharacterized protein n=1 Tax=Ophiocordyceps polyrhachis-furcata BCC 54312 TaxID=1330021 RepID=A0A367LCE9_9HYPO|nr:hypothetical protein L249_0884 [Ophiocordyceps polyrhachis-furcata BCC 54312]